MIDKIEEIIKKCGGSVVDQKYGFIVFKTQNADYYLVNFSQDSYGESFTIDSIRSVTPKQKTVTVYQ